MAFVHHTMLTAENLRGLPSKQLHTNVEPHYSPRSRAAPLCGVGGLVGVYSRPVIGRHFFFHPRGGEREQLHLLFVWAIPIRAATSEHRTLVYRCLSKF